MNMPRDKLCSVQTEYKWWTVRPRQADSPLLRNPKEKQALEKSYKLISYLSSNKLKQWKKQANNNKTIHLIISGIEFIWVKIGFQKLVFIGLHQAINLVLDFTLLLE